MEKKKFKFGLGGWIFVAMILGILVGLACMGETAAAFTTKYVKPIGTIYVNLLKFMVVPVVLFSIIDGVISLGDIKKVVPALTSPVRRTFEIGSVHGIICGDKPRAHALVMVNTSETETVEVDIRPPEMKHLKAVRHPLEPPEPFKYAWGTRMEDPVREIEKGRVQHTFKPREVLVWRW